MVLREGNSSLIARVWEACSSVRRSSCARFARHTETEQASTLEAMGFAAEDVHAALEQVRFVASAAPKTCGDLVLGAVVGLLLVVNSSGREGVWAVEHNFPGTPELCIGQNRTHSN